MTTSYLTYKLTNDSRRRSHRKCAVSLLPKIQPQSKQRGHQDKNFGYAILGLIVVSGLSSRWQHGDNLHAI